MSNTLRSKPRRPPFCVGYFISGASAGRSPSFVWLYTSFTFNLSQIAQEFEKCASVSGLNGRRNHHRAVLHRISTIEVSEWRQEPRKRKKQNEKKLWLLCHSIHSRSELGCVCSRAYMRVVERQQPKKQNVFFLFPVLSLSACDVLFPIARLFNAVHF